MSQGINNVWQQIHGQSNASWANVAEQLEQQSTIVKREMVNIGRALQASIKPGCDCSGCAALTRLNVADDGVRLMPEGMGQAPVAPPKISPPSKSTPNGPATAQEVKEAAKV